jgi:hypothetical protein
MNLPVLKSMIASISAPQFKQVYFDNLPVGCIAAYDYNRGVDIPYTFGFENLSIKPMIIKARDSFGCLPPNADWRVLAHLLEGDGVLESIVEALLGLEKEFCSTRDLIICYREDRLYPQYGLLIRQHSKLNYIEPKITKPKSWWKCLMSK